jgi:hypothetical protein
MRQRGRKTTDHLAALSVNGDPPRLQPPAHLNDHERALFVELIEACSPRHFVASDLPLLASYVQAILLSRSAVKDAAEDPAMLVLWEKATRMQATLATRLRLSPQSRTDPKTIGGMQQASGPPNPWDDVEETKDGA